ncbi:Microtubule-actin cross-linking factor 1, isoforms 1/2/3/5 [Cichlidogyrus casuarinus]|uniref:Microtubule-actin cross-linking factor 1, isoforms 1/2/3/5 n=1 Tax=Cichlidogyrus casuarinus TaxID=1844966 RepID=A0ABD2PMZ8_9PLAT
MKEAQVNRDQMLNSLLAWAHKMKSRLGAEPTISLDAVLLGTSNYTVESDVASVASKASNAIPAESLQKSLSLDKIVDLAQAQLLLRDQSELEAQLVQKQADYESVVNHSARQKSSKRAPLTGRRKSNLPLLVTNTEQQQQQQPVQFVNPKVGTLHEAWYELWKHARDRRNRIQDRLDYLEERRRLQDFNPCNWKNRYNQHLRLSKGRIMDLFTHGSSTGGRLSKQQFIHSVLASSLFQLSIEFCYNSRHASQTGVSWNSFQGI